MMGNIISTLRSIPAALRAISSLASALQETIDRSSEAPGLPVSAPTAPYWLDEPPFPELVDVRSEVLPAQADVVVIGSGIAGAAVVKTLLDEWRRTGALSEALGREQAPNGDHTYVAGDAGGERQSPLETRLLVLEARTLCSGATGRNGGHIKATPYETLHRARAVLGFERALEVVRFQMRHLDLLVDMCRAGSKGNTGKPGLEVAECRVVETVDVYTEPDAWEASKKLVAELREVLPEFEIKVWPAEEARSVSVDSPGACSPIVTPLFQSSYPSAC